jgi:hypothetical protein
VGRALPFVLALAAAAVVCLLMLRAYANIRRGRRIERSVRQLRKDIDAAEGKRTRRRRWRRPTDEG